MPNDWTGFAGLVLLALCLLLARGNAHASSDDLQLEPGQYEHFPAAYASTWVDETNERTIGDMIRLDDTTPFEPVTTRYIDLGFTMSRVWVKIPIRNIGERAGRWRVSTNVWYLREVQIYRFDYRTGLKTLLRIGEQSPFTARSVPFRSFVADLTLEPGEHTTLYVAYRADSLAYLPLTIETVDSFNDRRVTETVKSWSFISFGLAMVIFGVLFVSIMRLELAPYYAFFFCSVILYITHMDGLTFQYLWPDLPGWNDYAIMPIGLVMIVAGAQFARKFADTPTVHPRFDLFFIGVIVLSSIFLALSLFVEATWFKALVFIVSMSTPVSLVLLSLAGVRKGQAGMRFFLVGTASLFLSTLLAVLAHIFHGSISIDFTRDVGRIAFFIQGLTFALAIFKQVLSLRHERDLAVARERDTYRELYLLEKKHARASSLAQSRREQLAAASHDIRQPLYSLRMALEKASHKDDTDKIAQSFDYLDGVVQRYLDSTQPDDLEPEADQPGHPREETFSLSVVLDNIHFMFLEETKAKGLELHYCPSTLKVRSDPVAVMRIVSNFVSNAVKHTVSGKVLIGCRRRNGFVHLEVWDTGPGMTPEELEKLSAAYARGSQSTGSGLGLTVASTLAAGQKLEIISRSTPGRGSMFALRLPRA